MISLDLRSRYRLEDGSRHLHELGPRAIGEFLAEIAAARDDLASLLDRLDRYAEADPWMLEILGGSAFPRQPLHLVSAR
jgi:hypothetical protein